MGKAAPFHTVADGHLGVRHQTFTPGRKHRRVWTSPTGSPRFAHNVPGTPENKDQDVDKEKDHELEEDVYVVQHRPNVVKKRPILKVSNSAESFTHFISRSSLHHGDLSPDHSRMTSPQVSPAHSPRHSMNLPRHADSMHWHIPSHLDDYDDEELEPYSIEEARRRLSRAAKLLKLCEIPDVSEGKSSSSLEEIAYIENCSPPAGPSSYSGEIMYSFLNLYKPTAEQNAEKVSHLASVRLIV